MQKRGQFFLFAALIIVVLIVGLATLYNTSSTQKEDTRIYDLSLDLKGEAGEVISHGAVYGNSESEVLSNVKALINTSSNLNKDSDFILIFGNLSNIQAYSYSYSSAGSVGVSTGSDSTLTIIKREAVQVSSAIEANNKIRVDLPNGERFFFDLKEGQNFYLILKKERGNNNIVVTE